MTYKETIDFLRRRHDNGEAQAITRLLGEKLFGFSFADILCGSFEQLNATEEELLRATLERLENGEPIQYILGEETFCGRVFKVGKGVLIPRPETEELCQWIVAENAGKRILDIGTGSGAIAVTLALEISGAEVEAIDISEKALEIARENAERLSANVCFRQGDCLQGERLFENSREFPKTPGNLSEKFDIIVSNPPYVMEKEKAAMNRNVLENEPALALFVPDDNPLLFYDAISDFAIKTLNPGGKLYFEINPLCAEAMEELLRGKGFVDIELRKDQFGKNRMIKGCKKGDERLS